VLNVGLISPSGGGKEKKRKDVMVPDGGQGQVEKVERALLAGRRVENVKLRNISVVREKGVFQNQFGQ